MTSFAGNRLSAVPGSDFSAATELTHSYVITTTGTFGAGFGVSAIKLAALYLPNELEKCIKVKDTLNFSYTTYY